MVAKSLSESDETRGQLVCDGRDKVLVITLVQ